MNPEDSRAVINDTAIIRPVRGKNSPDTGAVAVMVATKPDLLSLCSLIKFRKEESAPFFMSRLYTRKTDSHHFSVAGPFIGSPYAVMIMDNLVAWGVSRIILLGWCGSLNADVEVGDVILPSDVFIDEGTSRHYSVLDPGEPEKKSRIVRPSGALVTSIREALTQNNIPFHQGATWTTDAVYRETPDKVRHFREKGAMAVEMELSAVLSAARFRNIEAAGLFVVSDELSSLKWKLGFGEKAFRNSRQAVVRVVKELCQNL